MKRFILIMSTLLLLLMPVTVSAAKLDKLTIPVVQDYEKAQEVLNLINAERGKRGLRKLKLDKTLTKYAVTRAAELCVMVPWKSPHRRPNGKLNSSTKNVVYECCEERTRGAYDTTANSVVQNWMSSPSQILNEIAKNKEIQERVDEMAAFLDGQAEAITEYSESLVRKLVAKVTVYDEKIEAEFKTGLKAEVEI